MTFWEALALGFVQGATEFLPVSSSGHLVIGQTVLGVASSGIAFEVVVHVATLASVVFVYRSRLLALLTGCLTGDPASVRYVGLLAVASVPAAVVGVGLEDLLTGLFELPHVTGVGLLVTGTLLWSTRWHRPAPVAAPVAAPLRLRDAVFIGIAQAMAIVPGVSRSGSTVVVGLWLGVEAREAAAFSFLMSIPAIGGAAVLKLPELGEGAGEPGWGILAGAAAVAALTGVVAIRTFVALLRRRAFHRFAPYCWAVGGAFLLYLTLT